MTVEPIEMPNDGDAYLVMADVITFRVNDEMSSGRLTVVQIDVPVGGGPPPLHVHPPDEVFHVVAGEISTFVGEPGSARRSLLAAGETGHVRGGVPHTFRNFGSGPARLLAVFCPGETMRRFFTEAGRPVPDPSSLPALDLDAEIDRVFAVGERLGVQMLATPQ